MPRRHTYRHLDDGPSKSRLAVELTTRELAERIEELNYGVHRFLSHLVDVRREKLRERIERYKTQGHHDVALHAEVAGDRLADELERLLEEGFF